MTVGELIVLLEDFPADWRVTFNDSEAGPANIGGVLPETYNRYDGDGTPSRVIEMSVTLLHARR